MPKRNFCLNSDSYKMSHYLGYPPDVTSVYSYAESRGGVYSNVMHFGLTPFLAEICDNPVTKADVLEAKEFAALHGVPFNLEGWNAIADLGYLPVQINAVPEGTVMPTRNVMVTVFNTDDRFSWLTSFIETALLRNVWYGSTVATRIFHMKRALKAHFEKTGDLANLPFALLDFSARGCSSYESNELGGAAYLAHFMGSDSMSAVRFTNRMYQSDMSGFSVPATEHSVSTAWGKDNEEAYLDHCLNDMVKENGILSVVGDTWDIFKFTDMVVARKEFIANKGIKIVVRPDSGEMRDVLPAILNKMADGFGATENSKGYDVLNLGAKVLWGDGINQESCVQPFLLARDLNISADSIMIGSGGGLMQRDIDRDTCKFAFKASAIIKRDDPLNVVGISKDPITDPGKRSKEGFLTLHFEDGTYETRSHVGNGPDTGVIADDLIEIAFYNGTLSNKWLDLNTLDAIRARIDSQL